MRFERMLTTGQGPYVGIKFVERFSDIKGEGGKSITKARIIAPENWSQVAVDILATKYARRAGVPHTLNTVEEEGVPHWLQRRVGTAGTYYGGEVDARAIFHRLSGFWTYHAWKLGYFKGSGHYLTGDRVEDYGADKQEENALVFMEEIQRMLVTQAAAPASPQWFNAGLHWAYGITGTPQGQWAEYHPTAEEKFDPEDVPTVFETKDPYKRPALSACFIQGIKDNLVESGGIYDLLRREALVFKYGGGSGSNFSTLRGFGEGLAGGGSSSGLLSFLKVFNSGAGAIKSGGSTRRAAKMACLDDDHPELPEFVDWKATEEKKVAALYAGSRLVAAEVRKVWEASKEYDNSPSDDSNEHTIKALKKLELRKRQALSLNVPGPLVRAAELAGRDAQPMPDVREIGLGYEDEGYSTVTGQNANNSIRATNAFMNAVRVNEDWNLYGRLEKIKARDGSRKPTPMRTVKAREMWGKVCGATWSCGDPGLQFDDTINEWHPCLNDGRMTATNPCSEYSWLNDTACNLASLNIVAFDGVNDLDGFNVQAYEHAVAIWTVVLDVTVSAAAYPSREIAEGSINYRTLGLGYANVGAFIMRRGLQYDSDRGRAFAALMTATMHYRATITSALLARELGTFKRFDANREHVLRVTNNHCNYGWSRVSGSYEGLTFKPTPLREQAARLSSKELTPEISSLGKNASKLAERAMGDVTEHGLRNAQITLLAPTGTIGLLMDCDTTGVEPDFALVKWKKLAGGGYFKITNQSVPHALRTLGYTPEQVREVDEWLVGQGVLPVESVMILRSRGVPESVIQAASAAVRGSMKLADCFEPWVIGEDEYKRVGLVPAASNGRKYLKLIGLTKTDVAVIGWMACGHMTVEGCPALKPEHMGVFNCANKCGKEGKQYLSVRSHLLMMAAVQPVLSGAISKTVNMDEASTVDDVSNALMESWELGLKATALYRDNSKMSQPLNSESDDDEETQWEATAAGSEAMKAVAPKSHVAVRRHLPSRCDDGYRQKFRIAGKHKFYIRTSDYPKKMGGGIGEIFIDCHKEGATLKAIMNAFAMSVSIGLQHGVPLEEYCEAFVGMKFEPLGMVGDHPRLRMSTSVLDTIFRDLAVNYLGRDDLAHVPAEGEPKELDENFHEWTDEGVHIARKFIDDDGDTKEGEDTDVSEFTGEIQARVKAATDRGNAIMDGIQSSRKGAAERNQARQRGYEGDACPQCRAFTLVRRGSCLTCDSCAAQSGCQ